MSKNCSLAETGDMLKAAQKLVIVSHVSPDGDTLGSSLALMHALRMLGKEVIINVDDEISTRLLVSSRNCRIPPLCAGRICRG